MRRPTSRMQDASLDSAVSGRKGKFVKTYYSRWLVGVLSVLATASAGSSVFAGMVDLGSCGSSKDAVNQWIPGVAMPISGRPGPADHHTHWSPQDISDDLLKDAPGQTRVTATFSIRLAGRASPGPRSRPRAKPIRRAGWAMVRHAGFKPARTIPGRSRCRMRFACSPSALWPRRWPSGACSERK